MPIAQKVIPQRRRVKQRLQHRVHEARVSQIVQPAQSARQIQRRIGGIVSDRARAAADQSALAQIWRPRPVIHSPFLPEILRMRRGDGRRRISAKSGRGSLRDHHGGVEVPIVDLVAARAAEELGAVDVDRDLVARRH